MSVDRTTTYLALAHLSARWAGAPAPHAGSGLSSTELRVFSQNGEDGVIQAIFEAIGISTRRFVEFGAEDGREGNCTFLAEVLGWSGLLIEASADSYARLEARYRDRDNVVTLNAAVSPDNIDDLLAAAGIRGEIDVLSIDIDGHDYWVWEAITRAQPRLVVIEYNAHVPYPQRQVQPLEEPGPWRGTDYFGASLGALEYLGERLGYRLVHTDLAGVNAFFVRGDLLSTLPIGDAVVRRAPNFFLLGGGHPVDETGRRFIDPAR